MMCTRRFRRLRILKGSVTQQIFVFLSALPKKIDKEEAKPKLFHSQVTCAPVKRTACLGLWDTLNINFKICALFLHGR